MAARRIPISESFRRVSMLAILCGSVLSACQAVHRAAPANAVVYAVPTPLPMSDPLAGGLFWNEASALVFSSLYTMDPAGQLVPDLALKMTVDDSGLVHTITLRADVLWHDGTPFTADHVVGTLELLGCQRDMIGAECRPPEWISIRAHDDHTVVVELTRPHPSLAGVFSNIPILKIRPGDESLAPSWVGTGPFRLVGVDEGLIRFRSHLPYHLGSPHIRNLSLRVVPDAVDRKRLIGEGTVDIAPLSSLDAHQLAAQEELNVVENETASIHALVFDHRRPPFESVRVRRAFLHAIDWDQILDDIFLGDAVSAHSVWGDGTEPSMWLFDPELARELIQTEAPEDGDSWVVDLAVSHQASQCRLWTEHVRNSFESAGLLVRRNLCDTDNHIAIQEALGDAYHAFAVHWPCPIPGDHQIYALFHSHGSLNVGGYNDPDVDTLIDTLSITASESERTHLREQIWERVRAAVPLVPLARERMTLVTRPQLADVGVAITPSSRTLTRWAYRWRWKTS